MLSIKDDQVREPDYSCPICAIELAYYSRNPNYVCDSCVANATDKNGRPLKFFNTDIYGGFEAIYSDTNEKRQGHTCFIKGRKCHAGEARMGGIVVELSA
ncbi:hypothetical protein LPB19_11950 [Marinobacter salinisoli]|uniref:Uncharacterized protein n=1 Tax=Marinobacter salinisoli TaxID=2769486 RepID=A0ABX7MNQ5_9GAMM|nr:hypothetical protein [Marinobacter salinisoli]QSP93906.1 hypothetical protein LPB19_11950 [Marinobacter salinisoli]